jgi:hypothetical protein
LADPVPQFAQYSFQKNRQPLVATKEKSACTPCLQKSFVNSIIFYVNRLRIYKSNIILRDSLKNTAQLANHLLT